MRGSTVRRVKSHFNQKCEPEEQSCSVTGMGSKIGCFEHSSENHDVYPSVRWNRGISLRIIASFVASILFHAGVLAAVLFATVQASRRAALRDPYIYITLPSPRTGIAKPERGTSFATSIHESHAPMSKISRHVARPHLATRKVTKVLSKVRGPTSPGVNSPTVEPFSAPSAVIKSESTNNGGNVLRDASHSGNLRAGESTGVGSTGAAPGITVYQPPVLLSRIVPAYPERARRLGIQGQVVLQFIVDQWGRVERDIRVVTSLPMLDQAAIEAVRQWRFSPARDRNGNPVRVIVSVPLEFTLQ
jgi:protein TonB